MSDFEDYGDLGDFDQDFSPQPAIKPGLESLPDADYEFEILAAELTRASNGDRICALDLRTNTGHVIQHTYWLNRQMNVNRLGYDLNILGFPVSAPLAESIPQAVWQLPGLKFRGTKSHRVDKRKNPPEVYHDLYVSAPAGGSPMPAEAAAAF